MTMHDAADGAGGTADRPKSPSDRAYLPTLDGWRAVAVSLVIGAHSVPMIDAGGWPGSATLSSLFRHAGYGVDIFFALSGFLITLLLLKERERTGTIILSSFYARRFFRIIPPMALYLVFVFVMLPPVSGGEVLRSLFFVRNYTSGTWYTGHFWSLSIEEHFYAVVPLLIVLLPRRPMMVASLALITACIVIRWYEFTYLASDMLLPQFRTENRVDALLWGSVIAQLCQAAVWRDRLARFLTPAAVVCIGIAAIVVLTGAESTPIRRTVTAFVLPLIIVSTTLRPYSPWGRLLEHAAIRYIGRLSYSLYIWQMMFLVPGDRILGTFQDFPLALILPVLFAWLSYTLVEKPFIRIGHHVSNQLAARYRGRVENLVTTV